MKRIRNRKLDSIIIALGLDIVAMSLFIGSLYLWRYSGSGKIWYSLTSVLLAVEAIGAIWLSRYWLNSADGVASITQILKDGKSSLSVNSHSNPAIKNLSEAINDRFKGNINYIEELETQIRDSQIKVQLLREQKRNSDAIIYSICDAVLVVDEYDRLLVANETAGKLFGFDFKNSQLKNVGELTYADELLDFIRQCRQSKTLAARREIQFHTGQIFNCLVSCVRDEVKERICGVVAVLHDITREKEISQMKNDFVSHVSHELKTPLASIMAYSEMLTDGEADDEETRKEFYSIIQNQAKRLSRLIEDILNISRIESGLIKVEKTPVSLAMLIEEQLQMIKGYADEKNIKVSWGDAEKKGKDVIVFGQIYADKDMISQVIVNLLSNAVKYTKPGGSIKIDNEVDEIAQLARFSVTDTGVGIPENELPNLFEKFYRVEANKNVAKGTGLGLNLVKQIVEKVHNGRVFVKSKVGLGSTFGFELPLATAGAENGVGK